MIASEKCFYRGRIRLKNSRMLNRIRLWLTTHPHGLLVLLTLALLGPFLAKPFNIDDPLFIWAAQQIQAHPGDPYGFAVNWYGQVQPMWAVAQNPPLASYYLAGAAGVLGWSEFGLHLAFLLPALAVILGTYRLAGRFCRRPLLAALATLFTPVFLVSATTVMCDVPLLAFWVWALVFWVEGLARSEPGKLAAAGLLLGLAALTKYSGLCLLPLLGAYALIEQRRPGWWVASLCLPLGMLAAYQLLTQRLYGHGLLSAAMSYAGDTRNLLGVGKITAAQTTLVFMGGCLASVAVFAPWFWRSARLIMIAFGLFAAGALAGKYWLARPGPWALVEFQMLFWTLGGIGVLALVVTDGLRARDGQSALLGLWILGTAMFAVFFNWTVNGRVLLPMAPAVGILLARFVDWKLAAGRKMFPPAVIAGLAVSATFAWLVARADYRLATAVRESARQVGAFPAGSKAGKIWFQGHWGFQYYLEKSGAVAVNSGPAAGAPGDWLALPANNVNVLPPDPQWRRLQNIRCAGPRWLTTLNAQTGAGFFFATLQGPLPFALGDVPPETVTIYGLPAVRPPAKP